MNPSASPYPSLSRASIRRGGVSIGSISFLAVMAFLVMFLLASYKIRTVHGNEIGVLEDWGVVDPNPVTGTRFWMVGFGKEVYVYRASGEVFAMTDHPETDVVNGRNVDPLTVNSLDNQQITFNIITTWHRDPTKVVELHKHYRTDIEERLIRPEIANEVSMRATLHNAIDLYSGQQLNELRDTVTNELRNPNGKLASSGVIVDRVVLQRPHLNKDYEDLIEKRQLAIATESQAKEQQRANQALADAARTAALKEQYEKEVEAQTQAHIQVITQQAASDKATIETKADALNTITQQEAAARVVVINAKAEADKQVALSEAARQAEINRAVGIRAVGESQAQANKLLLSSYSVAGSELFTRIKVAESLGAAFSNVRGYLPSNVSYNTVAKDFDAGVSLLVAPSQAALTPVPSAATAQK